MLTRENFEGPYVWHNKRTLPQDAQTGRLDAMSLTKNDLDRRRTRHRHLHSEQTDGHRPLMM